MDNGASEPEIEYTAEPGKYKGYTIDWATSPSTSEPGKWMGHFRAYHAEAKTLASSVANLQDNPADAKNIAVRLAKSAIDEASTEPH
jgi:hypothetical protein